MTLVASSVLLRDQSRWLDQLVSYVCRQEKALAFFPLFCTDLHQTSTHLFDIVKLVQWMSDHAKSARPHVSGVPF